MVSERPNYLPPVTVRSDAAREVDRDGARPTHPALAALSRSTSAASKARSAHHNDHAPRSPSAYSTNFSIPSVPGTSRDFPQSTSPPPLGGTTHAGGILPALSFFHPSRPTYYTDTGPSLTPNYGPSRSNTIGTHRAPPSSDPRPESTGSDSLAQGSVATSEEPVSQPGHINIPGGGLGQDSKSTTQAPASSDDQADLVRAFSTKKSREPLLPIGQKPKPLPSIAQRPPTSKSGSGPKLPGSGVGGYGKFAEMNGSKSDEVGVLGSGLGLGTGRMRNSLEKFLRRTLSNDTQMAEDTSIAHSTIPGTTHELGPSMEDLELRVRRVHDSEDTEFKSHGVLLEDEGEDITSSGHMHEMRERYAHPAAYSTYSSGRERNSFLRPRFPDYDPIPPPTSPPLSHTPLLDKSGKPLKRYNVHPSRNRFFLKGRLLTGGDSVWPFILSLFILFGLAGTWNGTTAVWWWHNESPAVTIIGAYLCLLTMVNMGVTAFSDPGILPRNLDLDPPYPSPASAGVSANSDPVPLHRDLKVRSGAVRVKYCQTCKIYRPPRSSHCRMCDNCVDGCDHHCQWVNNCVGRRNYTSFILMLATACITLIYMLITSALHLAIQAHRRHLSADSSLSHGAGSAVVFAVSALVIWPVTGLLGYHTRLLLLNLTTIEQIRNSAHKSVTGGKGAEPPNPFARESWRKNLGELLCRARGMSWLDAAAQATEDRREVNPGAEVM